MTETRHILVTGATGFIGSHLVEQLLRHGHRVRCLRRRTSDVGWLQGRAVEWIDGDLTDSLTLVAAVRKVDQIHHLAGVVKASDRAGYFRVNQAGTRKLIEVVAEVNPDLEKFVYMSSLAAAGPADRRRPRLESDSAAPVSWYGKSKLKGEQEVLRFADRFSVTILRPSAVFGPRDRETLQFFRLASRGWFPVLASDSSFFNLVHVGDVARACMLVGEVEIASGEIFHVARSDALSWTDVHRQLALALGRPVRTLRVPPSLLRMAGILGDVRSRLTGCPQTLNLQKVHELLQPGWVCDTSKARRVLGFDASMSIDRGVQETANWYRQAGWI